MNKLVLPFVETMITQVCNLSCHGCTNYSDLVHTGYVKWSEGKRDLETWMYQVDILDFGIMGREHKVIQGEKITGNRSLPGIRI